MSSSEQDPLLMPNYARSVSPNAERRARRVSSARAVIGLALGLLFIAGVPLMLFIGEKHLRRDGLPKDPKLAVELILRNSPVIDGHIDLPELARMAFRNNVSAIDLEHQFPGDVDIPRLKKGHVGGFFWSVYTSCPSDEHASDDFTKAHNPVRDTLEQIDVAKGLIERYDKTFMLATNSFEVQLAIAQGKIASLLGVEGAHQLGNSLAVLRQYASLGVRYMTLTHGCNNAFADSGGYAEAPTPAHGGLSPIGRTLVREMNRVGVMIDLSHVSDDTARQAIEISEAPVMWSHSAVRALNNISRNVPDDVLKMIRKEEGRDGVVMVNFAPFFVREDANATVEDVADHVEHIAKVAGRDRVGLGSDYDGVGPKLPKGLEDVSGYPAIFEVLFSRGWNKYDLAGLAGGNILRILEKAESVASQMKKDGVKPAYDIYSKRKDIPKMHKNEL